jgi:hypothetical protein
MMMMKKLHSYCIVPSAWRESLDRIPTRYKRICVIVWVGWKVVALFLVLYVLPSGNKKQQLLLEQDHHPHQPPPPHSQSSSRHILLLVTVAPAIQTETMRVAVARHVAQLDDFDVQVRWIVENANHDYETIDDPTVAAGFYYWPDATPLFGGSLYRQERFVIKDELTRAAATATANEEIVSWDIILALYQDDVDLSNEMVHEYIATTGKLVVDEPSAVHYLPLVVSLDHATTTPDVTDHPTFGWAQIYNDTTTSSSSAASSSSSLSWGWMATPRQLFLLYRQGQFPLPPFDDAVAQNSDDALYVVCRFSFDQNQNPLTFVQREYYPHRVFGFPSLSATKIHSNSWRRGPHNGVPLIHLMSHDDNRQQPDDVAEIAAVTTTM